MTVEKLAESGTPRLGDRVRIEGMVVNPHRDDDWVNVQLDAEPRTVMSYRLTEVEVIESAPREFRDGTVLELSGYPASTRHRLGGIWHFSDGEATSTTDADYAYEVEQGDFTIVLGGYVGDDE